MINILLVDDEPINIYLLRLYLSTSDINLFEAKNGKEAIDMCVSTDIDLIFMDINMPVMNGIDATIIIKKNRPNIFVICITGYILNDLNNLDCFDIKLTKPVNMKTITNIVKDLL